VGGERVGVRLSPTNSFNDIVEHETEAVYAAVVAGLAPWACRTCTSWRARSP
jgi:N-ethylmaleimide reductase